MTKKLVWEFIKECERILKDKEDIAEHCDGTRMGTCSMSYDIGYWQGRLDVYKSLLLKKKLKGEPK